MATLLLLELTVLPLREPGSAFELAHHLREPFPKFLSWLISFVILCRFWLHHHHVLGLARHADYAMVWLNALFLMSRSFIPFPTALMGEYPGNPLAVSLFDRVMASTTLLFIALKAHILRRLLRTDLESIHGAHAVLKAFIGAGLAARHASGVPGLSRDAALLHRAARGQAEVT